MARAIWNNAILAETNNPLDFDNNVYFPLDDINREFFRPSTHTSVCPWKGTASYFDIVVEKDVNQNAAWFYPTPSEKAQPIKDHVAFWKGVEIEK